MSDSQQRTAPAPETSDALMIGGYQSPLSRRTLGLCVTILAGLLLGPCLWRALIHTVDAMFWWGGLWSNDLIRIVVGLICAPIIWCLWVLESVFILGQPLVALDYVSLYAVWRLFVMGLDWTSTAVAPGSNLGTREVASPLSLQWQNALQSAPQLLWPAQEEQVVRRPVVLPLDATPLPPVYPRDAVVDLFPKAPRPPEDAALSTPSGAPPMPPMSEPVREEDRLA